MTMSEWKDLVTIIATLSGMAVAVVGIRKTFVELDRIAEQRVAESDARKKSAEQRDKELSEREANNRLKRTEFFLSQHRRLFEDPVLYDILKLIDGDDLSLRNKENWDAKRKLLVFFEEIALLVRSDYVNESVAYYMFGYYAECARRGMNFRYGIAMDRRHWSLFFDFADGASEYFRTFPNGPSSQMRL